MFENVTRLVTPLSSLLSVPMVGSRLRLPVPVNEKLALLVAARIVSLATVSPTTVTAPVNLPETVTVAPVAVAVKVVAPLTLAVLLKVMAESAETAIVAAFTTLLTVVVSDEVTVKAPRTRDAPKVALTITSPVSDRMVRFFAPGVLESTELFRVTLPSAEVPSELMVRPVLRVMAPERVISAPSVAITVPVETILALLTETTPTGFTSPMFAKREAPLPVIIVRSSPVLLLIAPATVSAPPLVLMVTSLVNSTGPEILMAALVVVVKSPSILILPELLTEIAPSLFVVPTSPLKVTVPAEAVTLSVRGGTFKSLSIVSEKLMLPVVALTTAFLARVNGPVSVTPEFEMMLPVSVIPVVPVTRTESSGLVAPRLLPNKTESVPASTVKSKGVDEALLILLVLANEMSALFASITTLAPRTTGPVNEIG